MKDPALSVGALILLVFGLFILHSISSELFPIYYIYVVFSLIAYVIFSRIDFNILSVFYRQFLVLCIFFLLLPLAIGQVTRGAIRWIPIGPIAIQSAEIVRPFLFLSFACFLIGKRLNLVSSAKILGLFLIPIFLILVQPSLGVTILTTIGLLGVVLASEINKKSLFAVFGIVMLISPLSWFLLAPYQKARVTSFLNPQSDPSGAGYNSLQSMISVGSGKFSGRGLGKGVQTQLLFLPEKHTDFIFAAVSEELGFLGAALLLILIFFVLYRILASIERAKNPYARAFLSGLFLSLFAQSIIHIGMNMGLLPITGVPLPLVSAGGSSLLATSISLGMVNGAIKPN